MKKATRKESSAKVQPAVSFFDSSLRIFFLLFALTFLIYGNSLKNKYSLDDELVTLNHPQVKKGIKAIPDIFVTRYVSESEKSNYGYRPIVKVTFAIEHQLFGENPHVGHFINLVLYALLCTVLFMFLRRIFGERPAAFCFWITLLFLFHPVHNEVVVSLKNRDALLSLLFGLLAMNAFIDAQQKPALNYVKGAVFIALAFLSKTDVLPFLFLIPFTLFYFRNVPFRKLAVFAACVVLFFFIAKLMIGSALSDEMNKRTFVFIENPLFFTHGIQFRIIAAFSSFFFYLQKLFLPYPLVSYYGYDTIEVLEWSLKAFIGVALTIAAIFYLIRKFKQAMEEKDPVYFGVVFFCVSLSMFLNLVKPAVGIVAERFLFVPSVGFSIAIIALLYKYFRIDLKERSLFSSNGMSGILTIVFLGFTIIGFSRNKDWKDHQTLYEADSQVAENSAKLHALAGARLIQVVMNGEVNDMASKRNYVMRAEEHYKASLKIHPDYVTSLNNLGMIYQSYLNKPELARGYFKRAIELDSLYVEAYYNMGLTYLRKDTATAEEFMLKAIRLKKDFIPSHNSLTRIYLAKNQVTKAEQLNAEAIRHNPKTSDFYINLGRTAIAKSDTVEGVKYLDQGYMLSPKNEMLENFLVKYYRRKGKGADAERIQNAR